MVTNPGGDARRPPDLGGAFELSLMLTRAPENDAWSQAQVLSGETAAVEADNRGATLEEAEPAHGMATGRTLWYRWTAPESGQVTLGTNEPALWPDPAFTNRPSLFDSTGTTGGCA